MATEREPGTASEGFKFSADVKPFVPKYTTVTVAWSEPSEACVFPTTYYPRVQEPSVDKSVEFAEAVFKASFSQPQICAEDVSWDGASSLSQYISGSVMGYTPLGEYSSSPSSSDAAPNMYSVASARYNYNNSQHYSHSRIVNECGEQICPVKQETRKTPKRRSKGDEQKLDNKRLDGSDSSDRTTNRSSLHTSVYGRDALKPDRSNKAMNRKSKQIPKNESLPKPAFEVTLSDFPKLQTLGSNDVVDLEKHKWGPLCSTEGNTALLRQPVRTQTSALVTTEDKNKAENKAVSKIYTEVGSVSSSLDTRALPPTSAPYSTQSHLSWATILSQAPKRVVSSPASELISSNHSCSKEKQDVQANSKSKTRNDASETEPEEVSEKKKKKKKKKPKSNPEEEKPQNESFILQEPPRIEDAEEFPDLAAASDRKNRAGTQKSFYAPPVSRRQPEVHVTKESCDSHYRKDTSNLGAVVTSGKKTGKHASSAMLERKKPQEASKSSGKKSQIPVKLDLGGMLAVLEQKQHAEKSKQSSKPVVLSVGGAIPLLSKEPTTVTKNQQLSQGKTPHNPLDSSAPLVKKGKQREVPKAKKPTSLKKIILKEREQRKQHLLEQTTIPKDDGDTVHQCEESATEDQTLTQDTKTDIAEDVPITSVSVAQSSSEVFLEREDLKDSTESSSSLTQLNSSLPKIHSRRFRDYCSQVLSKEVDSCVTDLLKELVRFQDRLYQKDPVKAKTKRRLVMGLREVLKHLKLKKLKCVIISPNCEKIQSKGGLDETLHTIIDCACEQNIPFVFALNRKALGRCVNKAVPVSVVGIFSYDGAQDHFHKMVELTMEARHAYKDMVAALEEEAAEGGGSEKHSTILTTQYEEKSLSETGKTPHVESDEDVPNYIKIWKRKLEEEYNPYALELEKTATTEMLTLNLDEPQ
ncbi:selenocysteine insertion sequence-binding protein 2 isoform X2 [Trachemys scripta elegans]|uniref:selenocysteine insertion sequence-binding protein 2 isoform X2 n=1 Tax=Trachemys scripta elegans TaxID=31138 RepID=UPI00155525D7|nr:selenocysteine insertion sequence-binding protein 2 isoform X2 [Trachemys scripta elegans]